MPKNADVEHYWGLEVPSDAFSTPLSDDISSSVVTRLKQEADRHSGIDPHRSLEFAERIIKIGQARGDTGQTALGWMARGDALKFIGQTAEAWDALDKAGDMFRQAGDEVGWARTSIGRLYLSTMLNCIPEALQEAGKAYEIFIRNNEREKLLRLEIQTAYVYNHIGNQLEALKRYQSAMEIAEELGESGMRFSGILLTNLGSTVQGLGDFSQAQNYYERAQAFFTSEGEFLHLATVEANLGFLAQIQGNYRKALQLLSSSIERAAGHSDLETTKIRWHMLECYLGLNRRIEARELAHQIAADNRQLKDAFELAITLVQLAAIDAESGNFDAAQNELDEAETLFITLDADTWLAKSWLWRGTIALKQGDALLALKMANKAGAIFESAEQQVNFAAAELLKGQANLALYEFPAAADGGRAALEVARRDNVASIRFRAHLLLGQIFEKQNQSSRALRHFQAAAATTERVQRGLTITLSPGFLEDKADAWRALIRLHLENGEIGKAFEILERSKSHVMFGYLANREHLLWAKNDVYARDLLSELDRLRAEHQWFYKLAHETDHSSDHSIQVELHQALVEVKSRERQMRSITERLYLLSAEGWSTNPALTPSLAKIQAAIDEDTMMVEFYNDGQAVWAFTLVRGSIEVHQLPLKLEDLNRLLAQFQLNRGTALKFGPQDPALVNLTQHADRILRKLYRLLIEPWEHHRNGKNQLVFVPYGALHYLPFHLLHDGISYLIEEHEIVILPASGLATLAAPSRPPGALVLAHSFQGRLPHTLREGQVVHQLFGGQLRTEQDANRIALQTQTTQILHIAAHGKYRLDQPELSYIQLEDGQLYADDLLQQDLSYELVTLSACETGRANVAGGEELIGLGRGILYAGAGALVLSLWPVPDMTTVILMESMYQALRRGDSKAAALREAQLNILEDTPQLHPAFWGAFQLVGNPSPLSKLAAHQ